MKAFFIVEMDEKHGCDICRAYGRGRMYCLKFGPTQPCNGNLDNRPSWCPLREVKHVNDLSTKTFTPTYTEVKE
jgi:hypothetical protein